MIKIVLTKRFVSYPKREKWKESKSPYPGMTRLMNRIIIKPTWKLTRIITNYKFLLRLPKHNIHKKSKHALL